MAKRRRRQKHNYKALLLITAFFLIAIPLSFRLLSQRKPPQEPDKQGEDQPSDPSQNPDNPADPDKPKEPDNPEDPKEPEDPSSQLPTEPGPVNTNIDYAALAALPNEQITWGPGVNMDELNRSTACVALQEQYGHYETLFLAPTEEKIVYLTFDEGYENGYTPQILDALKEKGAKAVFFVTLPYAKSEPELVQRMIDEGHIVGNHSNRHKNFTTLSAEDGAQDILDLHQYILDNFDYTMKLFRFPEGAFSERTAALLQEMDYASCFWSFAHADWDPDNQPEEESTYQKITAAACPGQIYLLHAVSETNTNVLGRAIDNIRTQGYTIGDPTDLYPE